MYGLLNILVCQVKENTERALGTARPCYRAATLLEHISKLCNLLFYWF